MLRAIRDAATVAALAAACVSAQATYITGVTDSPQGFVQGSAAAAKAEYEKWVHITKTEDFGAIAVANGFSGNGFTSTMLGARIGCVFPGDGDIQPIVDSCSIQSNTTDSTSASSDNGRFNTSSATSAAVAGNFLRNDPNLAGTLPGTSIIFDFTDKFSAFGFFLTDLGDFIPGATLEISIFEGPNGTGRKETTTLPRSPQNGSLGFFGFYSNDKMYQSFAITIPTGLSADIFGIDDAFIGDIRDSQVPEPSTIALLGVALFGAARISRRRQLMQ